MSTIIVAEEPLAIETTPVDTAPTVPATPIKRRKKNKKTKKYKKLRYHKGIGAFVDSHLSLYRSQNNVETNHELIDYPACIEFKGIASKLHSNITYDFRFCIFKKIHYSFEESEVIGKSIVDSLDLLLMTDEYAIPPKKFKSRFDNKATNVSIFIRTKK